MRCREIPQRDSIDVRFHSLLFARARRSCALFGRATVRQQLFESGRQGAELLLGALAGEPAPSRVETLPVDLVVRGTSGPPL
jgi:hypothetical protein